MNDSIYQTYLRARLARESGAAFELPETAGPELLYAANQGASDQRTGTIQSREFLERRTARETASADEKAIREQDRAASFADGARVTGAEMWQAVMLALADYPEMCKLAIEKLTPIAERIGLAD